MAETRLNSSTAGLLLAVVPLIAAVIVTVLGHDRLDTRRVIGLLIGFAGVAALVGLDIHVDDLTSVGFILLTALGYAIGPIIISRSLSDLPPLGVVTGSLIVASVIYAAVRRLAVPDRYARVRPGRLVVVGLAVICTAVAFLVFFALIAEAGPARATVITYINPAVAILLGVLVLSEPFTVGIAIGFPLVIIGSILGTARTRKAGGRAGRASRPRLWPRPADSSDRGRFDGSGRRAGPGGSRAARRPRRCGRPCRPRPA